ncbi:MAG: transglycosylase domain-containing protein, partial [Eggerthellales bacterium]|nr:transglycosylase domain-containing protein [Eggerthellales bacterium]
MLAELYLENREPVTIDQVSPYVLEGTVAVEDVRFYEHKGVDIQGVIRAVFVNLTGGQEGASTITQQFIRNTVLSSERNDITLERKWREMELALDLEQLYSKEDILMMYLNTINYGDGCYGIQAAAQHYYSVDAADLTIAQAATLIGIPNSPTMYNPVTNPDLCKERRNVVLSRMYTNGVITQEEYEAALAEDLNLDVNESDSLNGIYRFEYFTTWI